MICTLERLFLVDLRVVFDLYLLYRVRVVCIGLIINLYPRLYSFASLANNLLTLLSRLLSIRNFFTSRFTNCVLEVIDLEDYKRFRSTSNTVESDISFFNYIGGFYISINYSNIVSRDLGPILVYSRPGYKNESAL